MEIVRFAADQLFARLQRCSNCGQVRERTNYFGFDQDNVIGVLHFAFDRKKWFLGNEQSGLLE